MSDRDKELPPYFKEYLEQKFKELHTAISDNKIAHDKDIESITIEMEDIKQEQKWNTGMVKYASGAVAVISVVGIVFLSYFKTLNKQQIQEAILEQKSNIAKEVVGIIKEEYEITVK